MVIAAVCKFCNSLVPRCSSGDEATENYSSNVIIYVGNDRLKSCSWQAVVNTISGFSKLKENQFTSESTPGTLNLTFNFTFVGVPFNNVLFPGSEDYVWLGQDVVLITTKRKVIKMFRLIDADLSLNCVDPNDLYVDTPNQIVYISCSTGVSALSVQNGAYYMEMVGEGMAHAFVILNSYTHSIYVDSNVLRRVNLKNGNNVPIYLTLLSDCTSEWRPLTFNTTYFILMCKENKHIYLVKEDGQNKHLIPLNGELWNLKNIIVDLTASNFTFYKNDFQSKCSVSLPFPVSRVYSIDIDGNIILVLLTPSVIMTYNTSKGCNDEYLQVIANGTFPCFSGSCDGYHLFGSQYILVVSLQSGMYRVEVIDLKSMSPTDYHFNLVGSPQGLNAFCDPAPTSLPGESGSDYVHSINDSANQTSTQLPVPSPTSSININTTAPFSISTSVISSPFSVSTSAISSLSHSSHVTPFTTVSPSDSNVPFPVHIPASVAAVVLLLILIVIVIFLILAVLRCLCVKASKNKRRWTKPIQENGTELHERRGCVLNKICGNSDTTASSLSLSSSQDDYLTNDLAQTDSNCGKFVPNLCQERLNNTDPPTVFSDAPTQNP